jgi:hypothetical protein
MASLGQGLSRRFDRVEGIALGVDTAVAADATSDLHDALATLIKEGREASAVRSRPLDGPHPPTCRMPASPIE